MVRLEAASRELRVLREPKPVERVQPDHRHVDVLGSDGRGAGETGERALDHLVTDVGLEVIDLQLQSEVTAQD